MKGCVQRCRVVKPTRNSNNPRLLVPMAKERLTSEKLLARLFEVDLNKPKGCAPRPENVIPGGGRARWRVVCERCGGQPAVQGSRFCRHHGGRNQHARPERKVKRRCKALKFHPLLADADLRGLLTNEAYMTLSITKTRRGAAALRGMVAGWIAKEKENDFEQWSRALAFAREVINEEGLVCGPKGQEILARRRRRYADTDYFGGG